LLCPDDLPDAPFYQERGIDGFKEEGAVED